jgi:predicted ester cyclase
VLRWRFRGTHSGAFWTPAGTIPATGRALKLTATLTYRLEDGKIAEEWAALDWLSVVQQLGALVILPTAAGAGSVPEAS